MLEEGEGIGFALVMKPKEEDKKEKPDLPIEVQELLKKFKGIVSDGQPTTLPPKRTIIYQIDFIPKVSLPNKEAYKMNPHQNV